MVRSVPTPRLPDWVRRGEIEILFHDFSERNAYDEHLSAIMIQNDVLDSAKLEGRIEGLAEGREENNKANALK